jgi:hypothetical protein
LIVQGHAETDEDSHNIQTNKLAETNDKKKEAGIVKICGNTPKENMSTLIVKD